MLGLRVALVMGSLALSTVGDAAGQTPELGCLARGSRESLATRLSPLDSVTIQLGDAIAKICYSRPSARGRSVDSLVPFVRFSIWRTGANEPTTLTLTHSLTVGGTRLAPGRYVILTAPRPEEWQIIFNTTRATEPRKMFQDLTKVATGTGRVERLGQPIEQFTIRAEVEGTAAAFLLEWGTWRVHVPVRVVE